MRVTFLSGILTKDENNNYIINNQNLSQILREHYGGNVTVAIDNDIFKGSLFINSDACGVYDWMVGNQPLGIYLRNSIGNNISITITKEAS